MTIINQDLAKVLLQLSTKECGNIEDSMAVKLFNLRLIDYAIGGKWVINARGIKFLEENSNMELSSSSNI